MNQQDIIREWFYRLPNGYTNPPYSKKEMDVLHEVLAENDMNGAMFTKNLETIEEHPMETLHEWKESHKDKINEAMQLPEIMNLLKDVKDQLDQEDLEDIQAVIIRSAFKGKLLKYFAAKEIVGDAYQLGEKSVRILFNTIASLPNVDQVLNYFQAPQDLVIADDGRGTLEQSGLPKETLLQMITMQPGADRGGNATGPGEIALALLFRNVTNYTGGGDLAFDGKTLEVKGKDARLGQQSRGKRKLESTFLGFMLDNAAAKGIITDDEYNEYINDTDHNNISIAIRDAYELLVEDKGADRMEFYKKSKKVLVPYSLKI